MSGWKPEVGQECEVLIDQFPHKGEIVGVHNKNYFILITGKQFYEITTLECLAPIKTKADKYRDEQIENMRLFCLGIDSGMITAKELAVSMYEKNVRVLTDDEVIVKPLSDEQKASIRRETYISDYEIDRIQRELGVIK